MTANRSWLLADCVTGEKIVMTVLDIVSFADQGILYFHLPPFYSHYTEPPILAGIPYLWTGEF